MNWNECYPKMQMPNLQQISNFVATPLWSALCTHLESSYGVSPKIEHSTCSAAPGWNVKYKKSGRALCTLYPDDGFFTCLVSVGGREAMEAELILSACTQTVQDLYWGAKPFNGSRWLMIPVTSPETLEDAEKLIALRVQKKQG
jgi:hypothetical protein